MDDRRRRSDLGSAPASAVSAAIAATVIALVASAATWLVYRQTLAYGFHYDDYSFLRPYTREELAATFTGPWDTTGIHVPFYRPLTVLFYAARFEILGLDADAHHALSLLMFSGCAAVAGVFARCVAGTVVAGSLAAALFVAHPSMPYALAVWGTNQMHLVETLVVLAALLWWYSVRARGLAWWLPLYGFATAAFMIKEDGIMLLPAIVAVHAVRARLAERHLSAIRWRFALPAAAWVIALVALRWWSLEQVGGYGVPGWRRALENILSGLYSVWRLIPPDRDWQVIASVFTTILPFAMLAVWRRTSGRTRSLVVAGAVVAVLFDLPFALVIKAEQMHLVAAGIALMLAGSAAAVLEACRSRVLEGLAAAVVAAGIAAMALVAHDISRDFEPFGPVVLARDEIVLGWTTVPMELRAYLQRKREPGAARRVSPNPLDELRVVTYGLHDDEIGSEGTRYRWMSGPRADIYVREDVRLVVVPLRHDARSARSAATATIEFGDRLYERMRFEDDGARRATIVVPPGATPFFTSMYRIRIRTDRVWVPAQTIPRSTDTRTLGLQIGELQTR